MPVWLMPFKLYRLTVVTFRQCTKCCVCVCVCFFPNTSWVTLTWWLLVSPDVIFQMIKCITVFFGACDSLGSCFSLLLTQWTACLSCFILFFWDAPGPFSKFHHASIVIAAVFCFGFFWIQSWFILPSAVIRAAWVIWNEFDLKPWMNVKEIRIGARRWDWISKKRREKPNATLTVAYWASKLWSQLLQFNHHFKCEIEIENIN